MRCDADIFVAQNAGQTRGKIRSEAGGQWRARSVI